MSATYLAWSVLWAAMLVAIAAFCFAVRHVEESERFMAWSLCATGAIFAFAALVYCVGRLMGMPA